MDQVKSYEKEFSIRLKAFRTKKGFTQKEFAKILDVPQGNLSRWENGTMAPGIGIIGSLMKNFENEYFWILTGKEPPSKIPESPEVVFVAREEGGRVYPRFDMEGRYVAVPLLADSVAAGEPSEVDESNVDSWAIIYKDRNWIPHPPENYTCVRIRGSSMYPILAEGDIVAIDHAERPRDRYDLKRLNGKMVAFRVNGGVTIKWLRYDEEQDLVVGVPENHDELDHLVALRGDAIMEGIVGLVRWWWSKR